jgi:hypothetical protein
MRGPSAFAVLVFVSALTGAACARPEHNELADASFGRGSRETVAVAAAGIGPLGAAPAKNRFLALSGRKKLPAMGPPTGQGFVQNTPDVWGPFDLQIHTGFFDPDLRASPNGVRACLEVDDVGFDVFYDVCAQWNQGAGLWQVFAFTHNGALAGSVNLAVDEVELRVEQVDDDVNFYTRAAGAGAWSPVATTTFPAQTEPLKFAFGATGLTKGTAVGFDDAVFVSGPPLVAPTGGPLVAADVNAAVLAAYEAFDALDGAGPDFGAADAALADAADALDAAQDGAAGLPSPGAVKLLGKAEKSLLKAQQQVGDESAVKALKSLEKLAHPLTEAALLLNPQPFPPAP